MYQDPTEQFAGNTAINAVIHEILRSPHFSEVSRKRMRKRIRDARGACRKHDTEEADQNARHTFREFLPARQLNANGFRLEYSEKISGKTPDWYDASRKLLLEVFTCERGGKSEPKQRVADRIEAKITAYKEIVQDNDLFFIIAVYGDFVTCFDADDCEQAIKDAKLFSDFHILSGVIFFTETEVRWVKRDDGSTEKEQVYGFDYFANPFAWRKIDLSPDLSQI